MTHASFEMSALAQSAALALFNVLPAKPGMLDASRAAEGFVTDFTPSAVQLSVLREACKPINLNTLYSLREAEGDLEQLLIKQVLHYVEVYGLNAPGLFNLEVDGGKTAGLRLVRAISNGDLTGLVSALLHTNAPVADVEPVVALVRELNIPYSLSSLKNNELRIALFNPHVDLLEDGDDAVRWLCKAATNRTLLIKDKMTIAAVTVFARQAENRELITSFVGAHAKELAQVFNRHRRLIVPLKEAGPEAKRLVNRISRMSKTLHVPVGVPASKTVIARAARGESVDLARISLRDKFRYLNLIEFKLLGLPTDMFNIRNGKLWTALDRPVLSFECLADLKGQVLESLKAELAPLHTQRILLDEHLDYGLPISRKQALGNLPFGTTLRVPSDRKISVGIYWRNEWGAPDLDLSAIGINGDRIGWGHADSYGRNDFTFSGDVTDARDGACEFFSVNPAIDFRRALLVNIFQGNTTVQAELIAGYPSMTMAPEYGHDAAVKVAESWQDRTLLREKFTMTSRQMLIGFLRGDRFVLYGGRLGDSRVSRGKQPAVARGQADLWTVGRLLEAVGVSFDMKPQVGVRYTHDLRYRSFSLDKLERVFEFGKESSLQRT
jgi:hypothetical protein